MMMMMMMMKRKSVEENEERETDEGDRTRIFCKRLWRSRVSVHDVKGQIFLHGFQLATSRVDAEEKENTTTKDRYAIRQIHHKRASTLVEETLRRKTDARLEGKMCHASMNVRKARRFGFTPANSRTHLLRISLRRLSPLLEISISDSCALYPALSCCCHLYSPASVQHRTKRLSEANTSPSM
jgi:hypothetical protein